MSDDQAMLPITPYPDAETGRSSGDLHAITSGTELITKPESEEHP